MNICYILYHNYKYLSIRRLSFTSHKTSFFCKELFNLQLDSQNF